MLYNDIFLVYYGGVRANLGIFSTYLMVLVQIIAYFNRLGVLQTEFDNNNLKNSITLIYFFGFGMDSEYLNVYDSLLLARYVFSSDVQ